MNDNITVSRTTLEALLQAASAVLNTTEATGPDNVERAEVVLKNNNRKTLKEAVYQTEKALYEVDTKPLTSAQMSAQAEERRYQEDSFSYDKADFIEGRRR